MAILVHATCIIYSYIHVYICSLVCMQKITGKIMYRYFWFSLIFSIVVYCSCSKDQKPSLYICMLVDENLWSNESVLDRAGELAVEMINNQSDLLPDYYLKLCRGRSGCNVPSGPTQWLIQDVLQRKRNEARPILGIVGPVCSSSVALLGSLVSRDEVALLNIHMSALDTLEDRGNYPNSFGVLGSYVSLLHSAIQLIRLNNWTSVSVLYDNSILYRSSALYDIDQSLREYCMVHEFFIPALNSYAIPFDGIRKLSRIVFLFMDEVLISKVLCSAFHNDMIFPAYQYIVLGRNIDLIYDNVSIHEDICTVNDMNRMMDRLIFLSFQLTAANQISYMSERDNVAYFLSRVRVELDQLYHSYSVALAYLYFDAIFSLALAANNSRNVLNLSNYSYGSTYETDILRRELFKLDFNGLSGRIRFDNMTGRTSRNISIQQLISNSTQTLTLGLYDHENGVIHITGYGQYLSSEIPVSRMVALFETVPLFLSILALVATSVILLIVLTLHILTLIYRKSKSVKASSPRLSNIAFFGCYIILLSVISYVLIESFSNHFTVYDVRCKLFHVQFSSLTLGLTLIQSMMCVRTWRLYRIFVHYKNPGNLLADRVLIVFITICVIIVTAVSIAWISFDPLLLTSIRLQSENITIIPNSQGTLDVQIIQINVNRCLQRNPYHIYIWLIGLVVFLVVLSVASVILGILTKSIKNKKFSTNNVVFANSIIIGIGLIVVIINSIFASRAPTTEILVIRFLIFVVGLNSIVCTLCILIFLPPLRQIRSK